MRPKKIVQQHQSTGDGLKHLNRTDLVFSLKSAKSFKSPDFSSNLNVYLDVYVYLH